MFLFGLFSLVSCDQEDVFTQKINSNPIASLTERQLEENDLTWIRDFQFHLQNLENSEQTLDNYTLDESISGLEWLFNYTYSNAQIGVVVRESYSYLIDYDNFNLLSSYHNINDQIKNSIIENENLKLSHINISESSINNEDKLALSISFVNDSENTLNHFQINNSTSNCEGPFGDSFELSLGLDGFGNEPPRWPSGCGPNECGINNTLCEIPNYFAMEEIEDHLNANYRIESICEKDETAFYTEIQEIPFGYNWHNLNSFCEPYASTTLLSPSACDCFQSEFLNCLYCGIDDKISIENFQNPPYTVIPEGHEIISIDLSVDRTLSDVPDSQAATAVYGSILVGKPECRPTPPIEQPDEPIFIEICC